MLVEVDQDCCEQIVRADLKSVLGSLEQDYKARKAGHGIAVFDTDKRRDVAMLKKHIDSMKIVLRYYGEN